MSTTKYGHIAVTKRIGDVEETHRQPLHPKTTREEASQLAELIYLTVVYVVEVSWVVYNPVNGNPIAGRYSPGDGNPQHG